MTTLNWNNLKFNRCPKCNRDFVKSMAPAPTGHIACSCGFLIRQERYKEIIADQILRQMAQEAPDEDEMDYA